MRPTHEPRAAGSFDVTDDVVPGPPSSVAPRGRDRFIDVVRSLALVRVILWHTWSAAWLTWFPAMPAMFFSTGVLLEPSLARRGWWATLRQRARRLLVPFWVYGAVAITVMVAAGWRPGPGELFGWVLPVVDPEGSAELRGLWLPLWYVRAYVWFVIGGAAIRWMARRWGAGAPLAFALATVAVFWAEQAAGRALVPLSVLDALSYGTFVAAGMLYALRDRRLPSVRTCAAVGAALLGAALVTVLRLGPDDFVVNRSALLTLFVGGAGLALLLLLRPILSGVRGVLGSAVDVLVGKTLTIYLWHGFGLVAAAELVDGRLDPGPVRWMLSLVVVVVVTAGCVVVFGRVEDWAAGRRRADAVGWRWVSVGPAPIPSRARRKVDRRIRPALRAGGAVLAAALVGAALATSPGGASTAEPLSGQAVAARAGMVDATTTTTTTVAGAPARTVESELAAWLERHPDLQSIGEMTTLSGALVHPDGSVEVFSWSAGDAPVATAADAAAPAVDDDPLVWWSITKAATATWLMRSVEVGTVALDDTLSKWVPEAPHGDRITLEHLARHQSGISSAVDDSLFETTPDEVLARWQADPELLFEPGTAFEYSRAGYLYLGLALERATGVTWRDAMADMGSLAGVELSFDEDLDPVDRVTDPDGHGYRGRTWSSGGILSSAADLARFFRWVFREGVAASSVAAMTEFAGDKGDWVYGIGLMPLCPCQRDGSAVTSQRVGLDSVAGTFAADLRTGAVVSVFSDGWFSPTGPRPEFYELESILLDLG